MIDSKYQVKRYINEFSNETELLTAQYDLVDFVLELFQREFEVTDTADPMLNCYPLKELNVEFIEQFLKQVPIWDFTRKSYFVEAHAL